MFTGSTMSDVTKLFQVYADYESYVSIVRFQQSCDSTSEI